MWTNRLGGGTVERRRTQRDVASTQRTVAPTGTLRITSPDNAVDTDTRSTHPWCSMSR